MSETEQANLLEIIGKIPMAGIGSVMRYIRIRQSSSYQRALYAYPNYLTQVRDGDNRTTCKSPDEVDELVKKELGQLKVPSFETLEDWFAYFGDPRQRPSWFTYLSLAIERSETKEEAQQIVEEHIGQLDKEEAAQIERKQIEKGIETFYVGNFGLLEDGLQLVEGGRQYSTPIGRIDLLCRSKSGEYAVIEIKVDEADDAVFGQILRYIGWVHRNMENGRNNVRGIILAGRFPEAARYSRIGLLKDNHREFLRFKEHGLNLQTA